MSNSWGYVELNLYCLNTVLEQDLAWCLRFLVFWPCQNIMAKENLHKNEGFKVVFHHPKSGIVYNKDGPPRARAEP